MPIFAAAALPFTMSAIGAGATATGGIIGAHEQAGAASDAAAAQQKSAADALAFQKVQAHQDFLNQQAAQRGNYDQWAAKQGRLSHLGQLVGMPQFNIPAYVPMTEAVDPTAQPAVPRRPANSYEYQTNMANAMGVR